MAQVVHNLVLNGLEALPGGTVMVALTNEVLDERAALIRPGPYVRLRVADLGSASLSRRRIHIFDPFYSTNQRGSGLGLAVSHSIVTRHGGALEVNTKPGAGTTFDVYLPACTDGRQRSAQRRSAGGPAASTVRGRVLVMDDEEPIRTLAERVLSGLGCEVAVAADGVAAVARYRAAQGTCHPFDLVLLDLTVPGGMGGLEALAQIHQLDPGVQVGDLLRLL